MSTKSTPSSSRGKPQASGVTMCDPVRQHRWWGTAAVAPVEAVLKPQWLLMCRHMIGLPASSPLKCHTCELVTQRYRNKQNVTPEFCLWGTLA